jgi:preprotein translocase subunit SecG
MEQLAVLILIIHVLAAVCIIALVLVQQGRGAAMGAAFGSGASQTVFGSRGSGSFLLKVTIGFVILFFGTSIALNNIAVKTIHHAKEVNLPEGLPVKVPNAPVGIIPETPVAAPVPAKEAGPLDIIPGQSQPGGKK